MRLRSPLIEEIETTLSSVDIFRIFKDEPYVFFLDSGMDHQKLGRYSFIGFDPFLVFRSKEADPFEELKTLLADYRLDSSDTRIPFTGGAVGYLSYDLYRFLENVPTRAVDDIGIPDCSIPFYDVVIAFDHLKDKAYISSSGFPELDETERLARARQRFESVKNRIETAHRSAIAEPVAPPAPEEEPELTANFTKDEYIEAIRRAKEHISAGDIYQVNLSQRFTAALPMDAADLFERLRKINPAPFSAYLDHGEVQIVSASPERFLSKRGRRIETRPIKGTRPRGRDYIEDEALKIELKASAKDNAEHVMIVDLERNDLGRVCEYGSILPTEFAILETYSTVFHLASTVSGTLREGVDAVDCLTNCFPGGSITGAPKIRSMEIIDSIEPNKRSAYTGAIGYIGFNGNMDMSVVIRTFIIKDGQAYFHVGGGIVADSDASAEYQETLDKAKALMESLGVKNREGVTV